MKITNALRTRSSAVASALKRYNDIAPALKRPKLSWNDLTHLVSTSEFDLLRDPNGVVGNYAWAHPERRQAVTLHLKVKRAREEITRLNIEISRLWTFLADEHIDFEAAISSTYTSDPDFAAALRRRSTYRTLINSDIARRLMHTARLRGFTGSLVLGQALHRPPRSPGDSIPTWSLPQDASVASHNENNDDEEAHDMYRVLESLHLSS